MRDGANGGNVLKRGTEGTEGQKGRSVEDKKRGGGVYDSDGVGVEMEMAGDGRWACCQVAAGFDQQ